MAYITDVFGSGDEYGFKAPSDTRLFVFSPYYVEITGTAPNQDVTLTASNGVTFKRQTDASNKAVFPLMYVLKSFFATTEVGDVLPTGVGVYVNTSSKLVKTDTTLTFKVGTDVNTLVLTYDLIWGALQVAEAEPTGVEIYAFGTLPLTVTQNIGNTIGDNNDALDYDNPNMGSDVDVAKIIDSDTLVNAIQFITTPSTIHKTFNIAKSTCEAGTYLRWVYQGDYKYFLFKLKNSLDDTKQGDNFNRELLSLEPSADGLFKGQNQLIDITGNPTEVVGLATATYNQQKHIKTMQRSIKVWKYLGSNEWVEVGVKMNPIVLDEMYQQNQSIELTVILPDLYNPTL